MKAIHEVLNLKIKKFPIDLWTQTATVSHIKDTVTNNSTANRSLF